MIRHRVVIGKKLMDRRVVENNNIWLVFRHFHIEIYIEIYRSKPKQFRGKHSFSFT